MFPPAVSRWEFVVKREAGLRRVPSDIALAVIWSESNGDPEAVSPVGAQGLMQLMPATSRELGVRDPFIPEENIRGGVEYLRRMGNLFDADWAAALAAYNWGPGNMQRRSGWPGAGWMERLPAETKAYVPRVLDRAGWRLHGELAVPPGQVPDPPRGSGGPPVPPLAAAVLIGAIALVGLVTLLR